MPRKTPPQATKTETEGPKYLLAKENPLFTPGQTVLIRFVKFAKPTACAHCGKKKRQHWTTLLPFRAIDMDDRATQPNPFVLNTQAGPLLAPLTPVCGDHMLAEDHTAMTEMHRSLNYFFNLVIKANSK